EKKRANDIRDSIYKKVSVLRLYSEELNECLDNLTRALAVLKKIPDPIFDQTDEAGIFRGPIPSNEQRAELEEQIGPPQREICISMNKIIDVLEELKLIDIEILKADQFKHVLHIKNNFNKQIEPLLTKR